MDRKKKNIVLWIITWAGLLLLILYSPIGSPDLYRSESYLSYSPGVNFQETTFKNSQINHQLSNNYEGDYSIPEYTPQNTVSSGYSYSHSTSGYSNTNNEISQKSPYNTDYSKSLQSVNNYMGEDSYVYLNSGAKSGYVAPKFSGQTLNSNLLINQTNSTPFLANQDVTGGTDPGGDPTDPIPVGDATWLLIILAGLYLMFKNRIV